MSERQKVKNKFLENDEVLIILNYLKDNCYWDYYYLTYFLVLTGLRIGEAAALMETSVDLENRLIHVNASYDFVANITTPPKNDSSYREIHIQPELFDLIVSYNVYKNDKIQTPFFLSKNGAHISYPAYAKFLHTLEPLLDNKRKLTPHIFRHTHASLLATAGATEDTISRRLGHENSKVTREIYLHATKQIIENDNKQIEGFCIK